MKFLYPTFIYRSRSGCPVGISWRCLMLKKNLEWLGYRMVKKLWRYVKPFSCNTGTSRTDGTTELLYQYRASVWWRAIKIIQNNHSHLNSRLRKTQHRSSDVVIETRVLMRKETKSWSWSWSWRKSLALFKTFQNFCSSVVIIQLTTYANIAYTSV